MMFEALWDNEDLLEDVKDEVLEQMKTMHKENPAEFIYFLSLYNIFSGNLDALDEDKIIRKGAISCRLKERVLIPINMAYGSFICEGKQNVNELEQESKDDIAASVREIIAKENLRCLS